jgi:MFS family permease
MERVVSVLDGADMDTEHKLFYGWVIVIVSLVITAALSGVSYCFGVFLKSLESEFGLSRAVTSSVFSTNMIFSGVFALVGGGLLDRSGPRVVTMFMGVFTGLSLLLTSQTGFAWQLFITYGVLLAVGTGAVYTVAMATTSRWFNRKRGLALGIVGSAAGVGTLAAPPLVSWVIQQVGWRTAYILMGVFTCAVVIPMGRLLKKDPAEIGEFPDGTKSPSRGTSTESEVRGSSSEILGFSLTEAMGTSSFWIVGAIWLLASSCYFLVLTHIVPRATDMGISPLRAAAILSLIGGGNIAGKLVIGRFSDRAGRRTMASLSALANAGVMTALNCSGELWMLYLFGFLWGFSFGGFDTSMTALLGDVFGLRNIGIIIGTLCIGWGFGAAVGSTLGGLIFDLTQTYFMAFLGGAVLMLMLALLVPLVSLDKAGGV